MKKNRIYSHLCFLIIAASLISCSDNDSVDPQGPNSELSSDSQITSTSIYFPIDIGRYWTYNCKTVAYSPHQVASTMEYTVKVHVVSKLSDNSYELIVDRSPFEKERITVSQDNTGNLVLDENIMFPKNTQSLDPHDYSSVLAFPRLAPGIWDHKGEISPRLTTDTLFIDYVGTESRTNDTGGVDYYKHILIEKYARNTGLTSLTYSQTSTINVWDPEENKNQTNYTLNSWVYELIDTGQAMYVDTRTYYWSPLDELPEQLHLVGANSFTIGNTAYIGLGEGYESTETFSRTFYKYSPEDGKVSTIAPLPTSTPARNKAVSFTIHDKGYVCGGKKYIEEGLNYNVNDLWSYTPETNTWTQKAPFPRVGGINKGVGFSIDSKAYVGLGYASFVHIYTPCQEMNDFYSYDSSTDQWTQLQDFPGAPRRGAVGFTIGNKGYVGLGYAYILDEGYVYYTDFWEYNPNNDTWAQLPDFPGEGRFQAIAHTIDGLAHVGMDLPNDLYIYNPETQEWTGPIIQDYMNIHQNAFSFMIGDHIYYGSGKSTKGYLQKDIWKYTP